MSPGRPWAGRPSFGVELPGAGHRNRERPQRVLDLDRGRMVRQDLGQTAVRHWAFVQVGAHQRHATSPQPRIDEGGRS
jgi:hypothetical protein